MFTVDQQAYFQGFLSIVELFYYNISGGLFSPMNVNTGMKYVTKDTVGSYLLTRTAGKARAPHRWSSPRRRRSACLRDREPATKKSPIT